jgi:N-methylhydantoinase A
VEFVSARVRVTLPRQADEPRHTESAPPTPAVADETRPVRFVGTGELCDTPVFDWVRLTADASVAGPALVTGADTTVVVPPGATARVDDELNLHLSPPRGTGGSVVPASEP